MFFAHLPAGPPSPPIPKWPAAGGRAAERCRYCRYRLDRLLIDQRIDAHPNCQEKHMTDATPCPWCGGGHPGPCPGPDPWSSQHEEPITMAQPAPPAPRQITAAEYGKLLKRELVAIWADAAANRERSLQTAIGPSEIGSPCKRRLAYKMLGTPHVNLGTTGDQWRSWVGTQLHTGMQEAVDRAERAATEDRWRTELRLNVPGLPPGSTDVLDLRHGGILDHKFTGATAYDRARRGHVSDQYEIQADIYGLLAAALGHVIRFVAIIFWPANGNRADPVVHARDWDGARAAKALSDHADLERLTKAAGPAVLPMLPAVEHYCTTCPFWAPGSTDLARGCPGPPEAMAKHQRRDGAHTLIAPGQPGAWTP